MLKHLFPQIYTFDLAECTYHGRAYLITHDAGNIMVDSPDHSSESSAEIKKLGGISYIFITHSDDVGDAAKFRSEFASKIAIHERDGWAVNANLVLKGGENILGYAEVIHTPGHTPGSSMLLARLDRHYLFTGDTILTTAGGNLLPNTKIFTRDSEQVAENIKKLKDYDFDVILPGHGARAFVENAKAALNIAH